MQLKDNFTSDSQVVVQGEDERKFDCYMYNYVLFKFCTQMHVIVY